MAPRKYKMWGDKLPQHLDYTTMRKEIQMTNYDWWKTNPDPFPRDYHKEDLYEELKELEDEQWSLLNDIDDYEAWMKEADATEEDIAYYIEEKDKLIDKLRDVNDRIDWIEQELI